MPRVQPMLILWQVLEGRKEAVLKARGSRDDDSSFLLLRTSAVSSLQKGTCRKASKQLIKNE